MKPETVIQKILNETGWNPEYDFDKQDCRILNEVIKEALEISYHEGFEKMLDLYNEGLTSVNFYDELELIKIKRVYF